MKKSKFSALLAVCLCLSGSGCITFQIGNSGSEIEQNSKGVSAQDSLIESSIHDSGYSEEPSENNNESSDDEAVLKAEQFEAEVKAAEEKYQTLRTEHKLLLDYCREYYYLATENVREVNSLDLNRNTAYFILDYDLDGHYEMFVSGPTYYDNYAKSEAEQAPYTYNTLFDIENGIVRKFVTDEELCVRGQGYHLLALPKYDNGKVTGIKGFRYMRFAHPGFIALQLNDSEGYIFKSFDNMDFSVEHDYWFTVKGISEGDHKLVYNWEYSLDESPVKLSDIQRNAKAEYGLIFTSDNGIAPIPENGDNFLITKTGSYDDYIFYDSDTRLLTKADLEAMLRRNNCNDDRSKKLYLELAENEMAARYGYKLKNTKTFKDYFEKLDWYNTRTVDLYTRYAENNNSESPLGAIERANVALIDEYEIELGLKDIHFE